MAEDELSISDYVQNLSPVRVGPKNNFLTFIYKWKARNLLGQICFCPGKRKLFQECAKNSTRIVFY